MKKAIFVILVLIFNTLFASAETLKGGTVYDIVPRGFFGTWHVVSKMQSSNNPKIFNKLSVDIWNLSAMGNVLIL